MKKIVIKIGTSILQKNCRLNKQFFVELVRQSAILKESYQLVIVSSGAIATAMEILNYKERPKLIPELQALAAFGQPVLMKIYAGIFNKKKIKVAQILLNYDDLNNKIRCRNFKKSINRLFELNILPIINENDSVATQEISFGDNDILAAYVAKTIKADHLILLTDVNGLYDRSGKIIPIVKKITHRIESMAMGANSEFCLGGMKSKIKAAKIVTKSGIPATILNGKKNNLLLFDKKEKIGTRFLPEKM